MKKYDKQNITTIEDRTVKGEWVHIKSKMMIYILLIDRKPHSTYTDINDAFEAQRLLEAIHGFSRVTVQENTITYN